MSAPRPPRALAIGGSDSGGGAGIEADLKTFTALHTYGMAAVTAITAQNTQGIFGIHDVPPEFVAQQIDVVVEDIGVDAAKSGMLSNAAIVEAVADSIACHGIEDFVLDPVMVSESGSALLEEDAIDILKSKLIPLARILTPNVTEAEALSGIAIANEADMREAARVVHDFGAKYVLIKGGHVESSDAIDLLFDGTSFEAFSAPRVHTENTHGTGCTYAAAITAHLAKGRSVIDSVDEAKRYVTEAIRHGFDLGGGPGPLNHFWTAES